MFLHFCESRKNATSYYSKCCAKVLKNAITQCGKMINLLSPKMFRQINSLIFSFVLQKHYFHEIFVKKVTVNFRNFHTSLHCTVNHAQKFPWNQLFSKNVDLTKKMVIFPTKYGKKRNELPRNFFVKSIYSKVRS